MLIEEKFNVNSPIQRLFDFLLDIETVGMCIPGCEKVVPVGEKEYESGNEIVHLFVFSSTLENEYCTLN